MKIRLTSNRHKHTHTQHHYYQHCNHHYGIFIIGWRHFPHNYLLNIYKITTNKQQTTDVVSSRQRERERERERAQAERVCESEKESIERVATQAWSKIILH